MRIMYDPIGERTTITRVKGGRPSRETMGPFSRERRPYYRKIPKNASLYDTERCQSGRMGRTRNAVCGKPYRGFESLPFRTHTLILTTITPSVRTSQLS